MNMCTIEYQVNEFDNISEISYNYFTKKLHFSEVRYFPILVKYPPTSIEGGGKKVVECEFLGCKVYKSVRICTGAKICEFALDELKNTTYTEINEDIDFYKVNQPVDSQILIEAKTHTKYLVFINIQYPYNSNTCIDKPQVCRYGKKSDDDLLSYFICSYFHLIEEGLRQKEKIIKLNCNVQFIKLVPIDINKTPFVVLICKGIHTHPPSPPVNISSGIKVNLECMIKDAIQTFERVTSKKLISSNLLKAYFGKELFTEIHFSLNNLKKLRYLVNKVQQKQFPNEQGLLECVEFYSNDWVLASLNPVFSKIPIDIWYSTSHDTNDPKAVMQEGFLEDKGTFHSIKIHQVSGISCSSHDQGIVSRTIHSVNQKIKKKRASTSKSKSAKKQKTVIKQINTQESDYTNNLKDIEISERRLALKEKEITLKEREAELELKKL
ncbi:16332_t:CDS:2 [Dentiscutata heterogama]|uniref:16332_t:CDS:1 n=1 Tax=Dentiscutata heterogama TaxID=1316150 RepID=A0ACA9L782_9GLOM|nr:16332_t:CDS:2 [Dentiscutata heterogama]